MRPRSSPLTAAPAGQRPRIDSHVHLVGTGAGGSGCWYPRRGRYRWMVPLLAWCFGLSPRVFRGDFDQRYVERLRQHLRHSSLGAVVLLALDRPRHADGTPWTDADSFHVPNAAVLRLAARHPEFLAGVSIHPARPDAEDELAACLEAGAVLLKLIPSCQNIDLSDRRHRRFWERVAEAGLPVLVHTGREGALEELRPEWGRPRVLAPLLRRGLTVIAAHCGGIYQDEFTQMLAEYPSLYGDTAAFNVPFHPRAIAPLLRADVVSRLVHGSDLPAPVSAYGSWLRGDIPWRVARRLARIGNPLERDVRLKRALRFPEEVFTRAWDLLRDPEKGTRQTTCSRETIVARIPELPAELRKG